MSIRNRIARLMGRIQEIRPPVSRCRLFGWLPGRKPPILPADATDEERLLHEELRLMDESVGGPWEQAAEQQE